MFDHVPLQHISLVNSVVTLNIEGSKYMVNFYMRDVTAFLCVKLVPNSTTIHV